MSAIQQKELNISLRPALDSDEPLLFRLYASTRIDEFAQIPWSREQMEVFLRMQFNAQSRAYKTQYPEADHQIILSGEDEIGRIMVNRTGSNIYLVDITLLPEFRNAGIGSALLKGLLQEGEETHKTVRLHVLKTNPAFGLYERLGFSVVGEEDGMYLIMEWRPSAQG